MGCPFTVATTSGPSLCLQPRTVPSNTRLIEAQATATAELRGRAGTSSSSNGLSPRDRMVSIWGPAELASLPLPLPAAEAAHRPLAEPGRLRSKALVGATHRRCALR